MASPTGTDLLIPFQEAALEDIQPTYDRLRASFHAGKTKNIQFRLQQLRKLYWGLTDLESVIFQSLWKDLHKCHHEAVLTEVDWCKNEILFFIKNLEKFAKDQPIDDVPATFWAMKHRIRSEPYGTVLVMGAFNYPFMLSVLPMLGAIAAGNTVIVKPSEHAPHTAMAIKKLLESVDPDCYAVLNGALPVSQAVLDLKFDKIAFTGSRGVGTIVAKKAAETLTPVLLELGGQNPGFVTKNADVKLAARRLLWGKCSNAGQVCLSQNYAMVERSVLNQFIAELNAQYRIFYPKGAQESPDFCRIINRPSFDRIKGMLDSTGGKIVMGGRTDADDLYIEPTVVLVDDINDSMIIHESFGPIWSVVPYDDLDKAIEFANKVDPTPLSMFAFGSDAETKKIMDGVSSGGATINDSYTHASLTVAPFGGVGASGQGNYHGKYSFKAFSHERTIAKVPAWVDKLLRVRYMPYQRSDLERFRKMQAGSVNFDRQGNVTRGLGYWIALVLGLGGSSAKGAAVRWGILLAVAVSLGVRRKTLGL